MTTVTETPTLQSFIRDIIEAGENDPAKIADKTIANVLTHPDARAILFHAVYQVAKEEYRSHVRGLATTMAVENESVVDKDGKPTDKPRLRTTLSRGSRTVKHSPSRDQWLGERTWFPDVDRYIDNGEAKARNWEARARYLNGQLAEHTKSVRFEMGINLAAARLINAHHVKCLNEVPGFTKEMLEASDG